MQHVNGNVFHLQKFTIQNTFESFVWNHVNEVSEKQFYLQIKEPPYRDHTTLNHIETYKPAIGHFYKLW